MAVRRTSAGRSVLPLSFLTPTL